MGICNYYLLLYISWLAFARALKVYRIPEETGKDAYIGNIPQDIKLPLLSSNTDPLEYNILSGDDKIRVDKDTGDLHTVVNLDRETLCPNNPSECGIDVEVLVTPLDPFKLIKLRLILKDLNDNTPAFPSDIIEKEISESAATGSIIRLDSAVDPDVGLNSIKRYEISSSPPSRHDRNRNSVPYFRLETIENVDGTKIPQLSLSKKLDRESISSYELLLTAIDGGSPALTGTATILITVTDANDNPPSFPKSSYIVKVPEGVESGYTVMQLQASDLDSGPNAQLTYSFPSVVSAQDRSRFDLDEETGVLSVSDVGLDYESKTIHHLTVEAKDQGSNPASAYATVTVEVEDVNDEAPHIDINFMGLIEQKGGGNEQDGNSKQVSIKENTKVGTYIAFVTITDRDTGMNGNVSCRLKESASFKMVTLDKNENRYLLKVKKELDRELKRFHNMEIEAWDFGDQPQRSSMTVVVELLDENDNDPSFGKDVYELAVSENISAGAKIAVLKAEDIDDGVNAEISYAVKPEKNNSFVPFAMDRKTGRVYFVKGAEPLDAENRTEPFLLTVTATDNGNPPRNTTTKLIISVADENDNPPKFKEKNYVFRIKEDEKLGKYLGRIGATDKDVDKRTNGKITYSFLRDETAFTIKAETGEIYFNGEPEDLDREGRQSQPYVLMAIATDHGNPPLTDRSTVEIYLIDVNDNHPNILYPNITQDISFLYIKPQLPPTASALVMPRKATDAASGDENNGMLKDVEGSNNSTANPFPNISFPKEAKPTLKDALLIGSSSSKKTRAPKSVPVVITKIKVKDPDEGENGRVRFAMVEGNTYNYFGVDMHTGNVTLRITDEAKLLKMKRGCHVIKVNVDDLGKPSLRTPAWVNIYVTDAKPGTINTTKAMKECMNNTFYPATFYSPSDEIFGAGLSLVAWIVIIAGAAVFLIFLLTLILVQIIKRKCGCCPKKSRTYSCKNPVDSYNAAAYSPSSSANGQNKKDLHRFPNGTVDSRTSYCSDWTASQMQMTRQEKADMMMQEEILDGSVMSAKDSGTGDSMPSDAYHTTMAGSGVYRQPYANQSFSRPTQLYVPPHNQPRRMYLPPQDDLIATDEESRQSGRLYPPNPQMVFTSKCTNECRMYGHSDQCWMPDSLQRTQSRLTSFKGVDEFDGDSLKYQKRAMTPNSYNRHQEQMRYTSAPSTGPFYYDSGNKFDIPQQRGAVSTFRDENVGSDSGSPAHSQVAASNVSRQPSLNSGYRYPSYNNHGQAALPSYGRPAAPFHAGSFNQYEAPPRGQAYVNLQGSGYDPHEAMPEEVHSSLSSTSSGNQHPAYQNSHGYPQPYLPEEQSYPASYAPDFHSYGNQSIPASYDSHPYDGSQSYDDSFAATNLLLSPAESEPGDYKQRLERQMKQHQQQKHQQPPVSNYGNLSDADAHQLLNNENNNLDHQTGGESSDKLSTIREELDADVVVADIDGLLL